MKERPILFSGPMVRAILEGRKTQTRRVIKNITRVSLALGERDCIKDLDGLPSRLDWAPDNWEICPHGVCGDRLWVRETWRQHYPKTSFSDGIVYRADAQKALGAGSHSDTYKWKPSIHMPRKYCRLLLNVKVSRAERLQDISEADVLAEGVESKPIEYAGALARFSVLWDSLNAKRGYGWDTNPWVWVIEFERVTAREEQKT